MPRPSRALRHAVDDLRNAGGPGSSLTVSHAGRSVTLHADRLPRSTDRVHPQTGEVLDEHEAMEVLVGLESGVGELDRQIVEQSDVLKGLKAKKEERLGEIRSLIRITTPAATPLFDGDPQ